MTALPCELCGGAGGRVIHDDGRLRVVAVDDPGAPVATEEIFGPVLAVLRARDFDHAIELANGTDYALIDNGFNYSLTGWFNGDFDYSGTINGTDYALIDNAFNAQGSPL